MGKYFCDYCDVFLVSESPNVRKAHNSGRNHLTNVRDYYASMGHDKAQTIIDEITKMYENGPPSHRPQINNFGSGPGMLAPRQPLPPQNFSAPPPFMGGPPPSQSLPPLRFGGPGPGGPPPPGPPGGPPPSFAPPTGGSGPAGMNPERARQLGLL